MPVVRALSGDRTMINDKEIRRNNVATPVEVVPVLDEQGDGLMRSPPSGDITERKQSEKPLAWIANFRANKLPNERPFTGKKPPLMRTGIAVGLPTPTQSTISTCRCYQFINCKP